MIPRMPDWEIRAGEPDLAIHIMREVARWCIEAGLPMWTLDELTREALLRHPPGEDDFRVARVRDEPAAAMILQWKDPTFWPEAREGESGFIHKLCIRRPFAGTGLAARMVDAAVAECKARKAAFLRLDTDNGRPKLCGLYEAMGFVKVGRLPVNGRDYALYERRIADHPR